MSALILVGCESDSQSTIETPVFRIGLLPDTQGGTDREGQAHVALHPMRAVLQHQEAAGVDMVIALGDLTDHGSALEFAEWRSAAGDYAEKGIEFLPVMGNHETSYAYTVEWIDSIRDFIPGDAVHMPGYEWVNYYVVRENVLVIGLAYYNLPIAFEWVEQVVYEQRDRVDHIVVASHDGLIGAKYGQTREQIVEGTKEDNRVYRVQPQIREFLADNDVIYVQGHEHQYQRSLISARTALQTLPSGSTPAGGNYRMPAYTQIMAGNASYKGYEFRYGERDLVQTIVSQKNATMKNGSGSLDVNSSVLTFRGSRVDYASHFSPHTAQSNDGAESFAAEWALLDRFSRTTDRCEVVVYPDSIPEGTRSAMVLQPEYRTPLCLSPNGGEAQLTGGRNRTFNRTDTRTRDMEYTPGLSRAESLNDLMRLAYQWLFQYHESWTPNLNGPQRAVPDTDSDSLIIPEATIDLKEHITLSWLPAGDDTISDILIVSGTQNQTGVYQDDYGAPGDIEADSGLPASSTDGGAKPPVELPDYATKSWNIGDAVADPYALSFSGPEDAGESPVLAIKEAGDWRALAPEECLVQAGWQQSYLDTAPERAAGCGDWPLAGFDPAQDNRWWAVLQRDAELALVERDSLD
ncbi:metallophosphoesterase family protein [Microbulbifer halophilus]|uniref:Metallophosphoesterase family protein n=1 Tax=Microbulbifer halophilus TaxID=453963 RepID=A0ABW5E951_9GAMM|nr:metallophosphoesterase [Microbulbifer halophilus]MCW8125325.1 metallophosphoesterase [Microbulbifer halophilus]